MIKSMTGFGRSEIATEECKIAVEIKAVNHRYCDLSIKLPKKLNALEAAVRGQVKQAVGRGKIDIYISYEDLTEHNSTVRLNESLGCEYKRAIEALGQLREVPDDVTAMKIARLPEVMTLEETARDLEGVARTLEEAVAQALVQFSESRRKEGEHLKLDILSKLEGMDKNITEIEKRYPAIVSEYRKKLEDKVHNLLEDAGVDESRLATEVVIYADKICVDEETVRLRSHTKNMTDELQKGGSVGRKLDFIAQEMNREANTILSKANDIEISNCAIELKTEIEKIREQVQNIE